MDHHAEPTGEGRGLRRPATLLRTSAPPEQALDALTEALSSASFRMVGQTPQSRRLKVGSALKSIISEATGAELLPKMGAWGLQATVDLVAGPAPAGAGARVRIEIHGLTNGVLAVPYAIDALRAGAAVLRSAGHAAEFDPFVEASGLPPLAS